MTIAEQYEVYITQATNRKRNPIKKSSLDRYQSYGRTWILPLLGHLDISVVENGVMRDFVAQLAAKGLSAASIAGVTQCVKGIIKSGVDSNGNILNPRQWNSEFIDAPLIEGQKAPIIASGAVTEALSKAPSLYTPLLALLASSGLRVNEALALKVGPNTKSSYWDPEQSKLVIRKGLYKGKEQSPKTASGVREVDIDPLLNDFLIGTVLSEKGQYMFNRKGEPLAIPTLYNMIEKLGIPGFHSFRRFRITHLENMSVPRGLIDFWAGHHGKDIHARYVQLDKDIQARKDWAAKAGLGFTLPLINNPKVS